MTMILKSNSIVFNASKKQEKFACEWHLLIEWAILKIPLHDSYLLYKLLCEDNLTY